MRLFPAVSEIDVPQALSDDHVAEAPVAAPVSLRSERAELLDAPAALFQLALETTPAVSVAAIGLPEPTKLMLMATGTTGAPTTSVNEAECETDPLLPVMARVEVPRVLPVVVTVLVNLAPHLRLYRSFLLDEIGHDYVRTARAKGLSERVVMLKHVLRNAMIPILTNIAIQVPTLSVTKI